MGGEGNRTASTRADVDGFLARVPNAGRRADALALEAIFRRVTGFAPVLWGAGIVGYGRYHYRYASGREGDAPATGFSPRAANMVVYVMPGYTDFDAILARLGPHRKGKSCLYFNRLSAIDAEVLALLIRAGLADLATHWPVQPS